MSLDWPLSTVVLVGGHAVFVGAAADPIDADQSWSLQPFQRGEPRFYIDHIRAGVELAATDPSALLVFSGGATRREAGPVTEADSYAAVAERLSWWGHPEVAARTALETYARDSFENLLFGICCFRERAQCYPERVAVVSWAFKAARFEQHREAIGFPKGRFAFVGPNDPPDLPSAEAGEAQARRAFLADPYGAGAELSAKRRDRNPFGRSHDYAASCPEIASLIQHTGPALFEGPLPWEKRPGFLVSRGDPVS